MSFASICQRWYIFGIIVVVTLCASIEFSFGSKLQLFEAGRKVNIDGNHEMHDEDLSNSYLIGDLQHGNGRVKKALSSDIRITGYKQGHEHLSNENKHGPARLRSKRFSNLPLPTSTKLALFPYLAVSEGLSQVLNPPIAIGPMKNSTTARNYYAYQENFITKDGSSLLPDIKTRANITAADLNYFHSILLHGLKRFCPETSKTYKNMLKQVDSSITTKIKEVEPQLSSDSSLSSRDSQLYFLIRNITKCVRNHKLNPSAITQRKSNEDESVSSSENHPKKVKSKGNSWLDNIRKHLDEEGEMLRRSSQLDIIPNTINLVRFERLCLQMVTVFCSIEDYQLINENNIAGTLLLSVLDVNKLNPKPTVHQTEMEELILEMRDCLKSRIQLTT